MHRWIRQQQHFLAAFWSANFPTLIYTDGFNTPNLEVVKGACTYTFFIFVVGCYTALMVTFITLSYTHQPNLTAQVHVCQRRQKQICNTKSASDGPANPFDWLVIGNGDKFRVHIINNHKNNRQARSWEFIEMTPEASPLQTLLLTLSRPFSTNLHI